MKNYRGQNLDVAIEVTLGMITLGEVGVDLEKDSIQIILEEMKEALVDLDKVKEQVLIEIGLDALSVGRMIIFQRLSKYIRYKKEQSEQIQQMLNLEEDKTALMVLVADTYEDLIRKTLKTNER